MKRRKKERDGLSDSNLLKYWRLSVKKDWGEGCAIGRLYTLETCAGEIECHHIVKRGRTHLKYLPENGIPLCLAHHRWADTGEGRSFIRNLLGENKTNILDGLERKLFKDYLFAMGITRKEFLEQTLDALKKRLEK